MVVYVDATIVINIVEEDAVFEPINEAWLKANATRVFASDLTRTESLVKPIRNNDPKVLADFEYYFTTWIDEWAALNRAVFELAARLRAKYLGLKALDAIHLAAAIEANCEAFVTNEKRLSQITEILVIVIQ